MVTWRGEPTRNPSPSLNLTLSLSAPEPEPELDPEPVSAPAPQRQTQRWVQKCPPLCKNRRNGGNTKTRRFARKSPPLCKGQTVTGGTQRPAALQRQTQRGVHRGPPPCKDKRNGGYTKARRPAKTKATGVKSLAAADKNERMGHGGGQTAERLVPQPSVLPSHRSRSTPKERV